jgi:hypothetical protein
MIAAKLMVAGSLACAPCLASEPPTVRFAFKAVFQTQDVPSGAAVKLISKRLNDRPPHIGFQYKVVDEKNRVFKRGFMKMGGRKEISLGACPTRLCLLQAQIPHGCVVQSHTPYCFVASKEHYLRLKGFGGKLYFYVPDHCKEIRILGSARSPGEGARLRIIDPDGKVAASVSGELQSWKQGTLTAKAPAQHRGCAWTLQIRSHPGILLDDLHIALEGDIPPLLSVKANWAELIGSQMAAAPGPDTKK